MKQFLLFLACVGISQVYGVQVCNQKAPGTFEASPLNCNEFFMCRPGRPVLFSCPKNMYFDVASSSCGHQALCAGHDASLGNGEGIGPEYTPIETNPSRLVASSTACHGAPVGAVRLDTTGCRAFYQCTKAGPLRLECPVGTLFDSNRMFCEAADVASCAFEQNTGPSMGSGAGNLLNLLCVGKKVGTKYGHPTNCTQYFLCNGRNVAQLFTCPRGTAYHKERKVCDFANNVNC
uniref:Chitin-binding type-2 domain-containing protein n=1 Tax=Anopheles atroparvus TaxID=41427 RepID=A0AAG5DIF4_ANOAO